MISYPFEVRCYGSRIRLRATVEVMTNDGGQVESEPPLGYVAPEPHGWLGPRDRRYTDAAVVVDPELADGAWIVEIPLVDETMMRVDITSELV